MQSLENYEKHIERSKTLGLVAQINNFDNINYKEKQEILKPVYNVLDECDRIYALATPKMWDYYYLMDIYPNERKLLNQEYINLKRVLKQCINELNQYGAKRF